MTIHRRIFVLLFLLWFGVAACGDSGSTTNPAPDMGADSTVDADTDADEHVDAIAPTVSITSGVRSSTAGNYRLEGIALDNQAVTGLSYSIDDSAAVQITPIASPFTVDLSLGATAKITVTAIDAAGNEGTASVEVTRATVDELTADFAISAGPSTYGPVAFDASITVDPQERELTYDWDFGEGHTGGGVKTSYLYKTPGTYAVKLVVHAPDGETDEIVRDVVVVDSTAVEMATLSGVVLDTRGAPVHDVEIQDREGQVLGLSDREGRFSITAGAGVPLVLLFRRADYATQLLRTQIEVGATGQAAIQMTPRTPPVFLLDAAAGGTIAGPLGARIEFPADALVNDETGESVTGPVAVTVTPIDLQSDRKLAFPGAFQAYAPDGVKGPLASQGAMEVEVSQNGQKVRLAPDALAVVEVPYTVDGGQSGTTTPLWSLVERTGYWTQEAPNALIQTATFGATTLVQRVEVKQLGWLGGASFDPTPAIGVTFEFKSSGVSVADEFKLDITYTCQDQASGQHIPDAKSGAESMLSYANCDAAIHARSTSGRYFGEALVNTGDGTVPVVVDVLDSESLSVLTQAAPVQAALLANGKAYYAFTAMADSGFGIRVKSLGAGLNGSASLIPPTRMARPSQTFDATGDTTIYATAGDAGLWVVEIDATLGTGNVEIEWIADPLPILENHVTQTTLLPVSEVLKFVVNASENDLTRILATGAENLSLSLQDGKGNDLVGAFGGAVDTGLLRVERGGTYLVQVQNLGAEATVALTFAPSAPPTVMTSSHVAPQVHLNPAQVGVFILPHIGDSGVVAHVQSSTTAAAPQVSMFTGDSSSLPSRDLALDQFRNAEETEAFSALRVPVLANQNIYSTYVTVAMTDHDETNFDLEIDRMEKSDAITVGTCVGAQTPSVTAAAIALAKYGTLTLCPEDHSSFSGLRMDQEYFILKGMDRDLSRLVPWSTSNAALSAGTYRQDPTPQIFEAIFEDFTMINRATGIFIDGADTIRVERVNIDAAAPLNSGFERSRCLYSTGTFGVASVVDVIDSRCTNAQDALSLTTIGKVTIQDNVFTGVQGAIGISLLADLAIITGNDITQLIGAANGTGSIYLTLRNQTISAPAIQSKIQNNTIRMAGLNSYGIIFGYYANNGDLLIDGNNIIGSASGQTGIRGNNSATNVHGGVVNIQNNIIRDAGKHAIQIMQTDTYTSLELFNNSVRVPITGVNASIFDLGTKSSGGMGIVDIYNNILMGGGTAKAIAYTASLSMFYDNNIFYQVGTPYRPSGAGPAGTLGLADLENTDPLFVNDDLMVDPASPAVDGGTSAGLAPFTSYGGGVRPVGLENDIGAHEQ